MHAGADAGKEEHRGSEQCCADEDQLERFACHSDRQLSWNAAPLAALPQPTLRRTKPCARERGNRFTRDGARGAAQPSADDERGGIAAGPPPRRGVATATQTVP